jgi:hypothetical protein
MLYGLFAGCSVNPTASSKWDDDPRAQAPQAVAIARELCACDYSYHILWPLFRAAGIRGALRAHENELLSRFIAPIISDGTRILIAGSADTATLCTIGRMCGTHRPQFTVLDRCPAPLKLIQQFAAERDIPCSTLHADLTSYTGEACWDIVLMHYTFHFVPPEERFNVLERLVRSLRPGGKLVCVNKAVPRISAEAASTSASAWVEKSWRKLQAEGLESALPAALYDQLLRQAAEAAVRRRIAIASAAELIGGMRRCGLTLIEQDVAARASADRLAADSSIILAASRPS